jgi:hypothetical protein
MTTVERRGPLTQAQQDWLRWVPIGAASSFADNINVVLATPAMPVEAATAAIRAVLHRHEGLRTIIEPGSDGRLGRQHVLAVDDRLHEVLTVTGDGPDGPVFGSVKRTSFRLDQQWPIAVVLFTDGELVHRLGFSVDHLASDVWAIRVLCDDLTEALRARADDRQPFGDRPRPEQPIDVAVEEATPASLAYQRRAQGFWASQLASLRDQLTEFTPREPYSAGGAGRRFHTCVMSSSRSAAAAKTVADALRIPVSAVYLHAFGAAICTVEGSPVAGLFPQSSNRWTPEAKSSVRLATTIAAPVVVPAPDRVAAAEAIVDCARQQLGAHRFANADPLASDRMCVEQLKDFHRVGKPFARFNFMDATVLGDDADRFAPISGQEETIAFLPPAPQGPHHMLKVQHWDSRAQLTLQWREDTGWSEHAAAIMHGMVDLLVAQASCGPR